MSILHGAGTPEVEVQVNDAERAARVHAKECGQRAPTTILRGREFRRAKESLGSVGLYGRVVRALGTYVCFLVVRLQFREADCGPHMSLYVRRCLARGGWRWTPLDFS